MKKIVLALLLLSVLALGSSTFAEIPCAAEAVEPSGTAAATEVETVSAVIEIVICSKCGEIVGSEFCCAPGMAVCPGCGMHPESPGCKAKCGSASEVPTTPADAPAVPEAPVEPAPNL